VVRASATDRDLAAIQNIVALPHGGIGHDVGGLQGGRRRRTLRCWRADRPPPSKNALCPSLDEMYSSPKLPRPYLLRYP
jgi:hypothetical protein